MDAAAICCLTASRGAVNGVPTTPDTLPDNVSALGTLNASDDQGSGDDPHLFEAGELSEVTDNIAHPTCAGK
ncbi:hypothetical protein [Mycobacteroides abscessus]|uniref:hypothetical protein n=1 Tax=Mycobacteroides abscessus TaxID=36809 RepID=UPI0009A840B7|nr:hypothetical protein [Mycobacteroides abscessus]